MGGADIAIVRPAIAGSLPLRAANKIEAGDRILYTPRVADNEKRKGEVAMILAPSQPDGAADLVVLSPKRASAPAEWLVPTRTRMVAYVYGPSGLDAGRVKRFLTRDPELMSQLATYAENTLLTESLLRALATEPASGAGDSLNAAIQGFASQYGVNNRLNRSAPSDQQTLALFRALNPALAGYDPISPQGPQRLSQTASLATVVAGMFLGNPVGLAAGGAAMGINFKSILFPGTEFRSAFAQSSAVGLTLCGKHEPSRGRARVAYVWAMRVPDAEAPALSVEGPRHLMLGVPNSIAVGVADPKLLERVRSWRLAPRSGSGDLLPPVRVQGKSLELDLRGMDSAPGEYALKGDWDENELLVANTLVLHAPPSLRDVRLTLATHDRLVERTGRQVLTLEGADFQFMEKLAIARKGDSFGEPVPLPFRLPRGAGQGVQDRVDFEADTDKLARGDFELRMVQRDGKTSSAGLTVLAPPPRLEKLPLLIHAGDANESVRLDGEGVDRISSLEADGIEFRLVPTERRAQAVLSRNVRPGQVLDLRVRAEGYVNAIRIPAGVRVGPPRPAIVSAKVLTPTGVGVGLRDGELPAGVAVGAVLDIRNAQPRMVAEVACAGGRKLRAAVGEQRDGLKAQSLGADRVYLAFDPGAWPMACMIEASLEGADQGVSAPRTLGRVVRVPRIDAFRLSDESAGDGAFFGVLTGRDLELIERAGWSEQLGLPVADLPANATGGAQTLRIRVLWPSPTPHAPLFVWLRGDSSGRATTARQ